MQQTVTTAKSALSKDEIHQIVWLQAPPADGLEDSEDEWLNFGEFCQALYEVCFWLSDAFGESEVEPAQLLAVPGPCKRPQ